MRNLFQNPDHQHSFDMLGYIQIPLLNADDLLQLTDIFERYSREYPQAFHTSHFSTDTDYKSNVHDSIVNTLYPRLKDILLSCRPAFGNFMIKNPDKKIFMPLHADWTYVDENQYRSMSVWVPLVDTDENNGSLGVIAGSHRVMNKIRGPRIRQSSYDHDKLWTQKYGKLLPAKAGTAVIYDHALMHFSPPNYSSIPRPAINLSLVPDEAQAIHYCIPEGAHDIEKYEVNDKSFYMEYDNFQRPRRQKPIEHLPVDSVKWIDEKMNNFIVPVMKKKTIWSHFWGV